MRCSPLTSTVIFLSILHFVTHFSCVPAVNLKECRRRIQNQRKPHILPPPPPSPLNTPENCTSPPLIISYELCLTECGAGMGDIDWQDFSQNFGAWFLPWISLMFQIPFGAEQPLDDVLGFLITIGSPALAAYSLQITHLNKSWIHKAFLDVKYPNANLIPTALTAFHHIPIEMDPRPPLLQSLIVLPKNDAFWSHLAAANKTRRWTVPLVMSYVLVIFSVVLTIIDSTSRHGRTGYGIAAVWAFLLPLVIGWLHVGCEPEPSHLRNSLAAANQNAWVATGQRNQPAKMTDSMAIEFVDPDGLDLARNDELKPVPVFNYSRAFVTPMAAEVVLRMTKNAAANAKRKVPVENSIGGGVPVWVEGENGDILPENRVGAATEVVEYCARVLELEWNPGSATSFGTQSPDMPVVTYPPFDNVLVTPSRWATGIWARVVVASVLALGLQWGTVGAAVFIHRTSPPAGLGCRAFGFLLYGVAGTLSFFFFLASSILTHMSRPLPGRVPTRSRSRRYQNAGAIVCRWLGKCVAIASAISVLLMCFFHVAGAFDNCLCNSTTRDGVWGFITIKGPHTISGSKHVRILIRALVMAFITSILFGFSMYMGLPPRRYE